VDIGRITSWYVGTLLGPNELCMEDTCQGYAVRGDTLALANGERTVFVRADSYVGVGTSGSDVERSQYGDAPAATRPLGSGR
jgi:hypothetical protein